MRVFSISQVYQFLNRAGYVNLNEEKLTLTFKQNVFFSNLPLILETKYILQTKGKPKASYHLGIMQNIKSHRSEESPWEIKNYLVSRPLPTAQDHHPAVMYKRTFTCKSATIQLIFVRLTLIVSPLLLKDRTYHWSQRNCMRATEPRIRHGSASLYVLGVSFEPAFQVLSSSMEAPDNILREFEVNLPMGKHAFILGFHRRKSSLLRSKEYCECHISNRTLSFSQFHHQFA